MSASLVVTCVIALSTGTYKEPSSLDAMRDCHQKKIEQASAAYVQKKKVVPSPELIEAWEDIQREETRAYLARHPDLASISTGDTRVDTGDAGEPGGSESSSVNKDLENKLWEKSDGGKKGVTPEMAQDIIAHLKAQQKGEVSPEMMSLLDSLSKDGPNLTEGSMKKMRAAARKAKASGMDLGVDPEIEKSLLEDAAPGHN